MQRSPDRFRQALVTLGLVVGLVACSGDDDGVTAPDDAPVTTTADDDVPVDPPDDATTTTTITTTTTTTTMPPADPAGDDGDGDGDGDGGGGDNGEHTIELDMSVVDDLVTATIEEAGLNGAGLAIVHRDHGIVHEAYWGVFDADRISLVASSSKMVTAGVLARLHDDGLLDLDAPVAEALDGLADWGAARPDITPAQLVSNTSGLVGLGPDPGYAPYLCQFLPVGTLQDCAAQIFTTTDDAADVVPPETEFRYGGGQWQVAGGIAEVVSGRSWAELIDEIYVRPCGLVGFGYNNHFAQLAGGFAYPTEFEGDLSLLAPTENPNMEGGLYTTVPDYARVLLMHLRGGECDGGRVLSAEALERTHTDRTDELIGVDQGYALGWWIDRTTGRLTDPGAYGSVAWLDLGAGHGGFLVIESVGGTGGELATELYEPVADALARAGLAS